MSSSDRPLRLLYLNYEYPPLGGGGGVVTRDLAESFVGRADITVITSQWDDLAEDAVENGVRLVRVPVLNRRDRAAATLTSLLSFAPACLRAGRRLMREQSFDLVHSFFAVPTGFCGIRLAQRAGVPHVLSIMGGDIYDPTKALSPHRVAPLRWTVRRVIRKSARVVAESNDIRQRASDIYGAPRIDLIRHGFRVPSFEPSTRTALDLGLADTDRVLVAVGRLVPRKRMDALVRVVARLPEDVKLVIVGDGPERDGLLAQAKTLGIADRVRLTGFVSEERKFQILAASDLFVYTTQHEGFGLVYLEAMHCGLPVVTYDCGGQADFLSSEVGTLVPEGDEGGFLDAVRTIIDDAALKARLSAAARLMASDLGMDAVVDDYLALYRETLKSSNGSGP